jgi:transposase
MVVLQAATIELSRKQRQILEKLSRGTHTPLHLKTRAHIILKASDDMNNKQIARHSNLNRNQVKKWRNRWAQSAEAIAQVETERPHSLKRTIHSVLSDEQRSGRPRFFTDEQVSEIITLSCQSPKDKGLPFSHWTPGKLASQAEKENIVESISTRSISRFLRLADLKPHQSRVWLNPKIDDPKQHQEEVRDVCDIYQEAPVRNEYIFSTDEKTGIQALEHAHPTKPMKPGYPEKRGQEYIRHGTIGLIASRDVQTGKVTAPMIRSTRTERDFVEHIEDVVSKDPKASYVFVVDQLNTHQSESLVRFAAEQCGIPQDSLGKKGHSGILKSKKTRKKFLKDKSHRIRFIYTPKHCSWLNQIEIWFSILSRDLINPRSSFKSLEDLVYRLEQYIDYYNRNLAKAFRWTYKGRPLQM